MKKKTLELKLEQKNISQKNILETYLHYLR